MQLPPFSRQDMVILLGVLGSAILSLLFGGFLRWWTLRQPTGTSAMEEVARAIQLITSRTHIIALVVRVRT